MRPQMIPLAELLDDEMNSLSGIGNKHGDIYESILDFAKNSKLNKGVPPPYYEETLRPLILGNGDQGKFKL